MSGKSVLGLLFVFGLVGLAYSVSMRLSSEALNVIVGVLCGVGASIPVSIGLMLALTRNRQAEAEYSDSYGDPAPAAYQPVPYTPPAPPQPYPPIIVMSPGQLPNPYQLPPNALPPGYTMNEPPRTRDFKIIGEDDDDL